MRLTLISIFFCTQVYAQSIDFGIEVQNNYNTVENFFDTDPYDPNNLAVSVTNLDGDTTNVYFNQFKMENNFEIPLYFRFNLRKRWFFDFKLSNSSNRLTMQGVGNFNKGYYTKNYGTYEQYVTDANAQGFSADSSDYANYIGAARDLNESEVNTVEEFKLLMFTANAGLRLFPQKSVKMIVGAGFTVKHKYRKHLYNYLDYTQPHVQDLRSVESGLDWFAEKSTYFNFMIGLEFYKFRLSAYSQLGISYTFPEQNFASDVTYAADGTAFDVVRSYGFSLSANLFSMDIGKRVHLDDVSTDDIIVSNVKRKKERWDLGIQYDRRGFNDMYTFYSDPELRLSIMTLDTILYNDNGTFKNALDMELITLGDIKRINWGGRLSGFLNIHLTDRLSLKGMLGGSVLTYDVTTTQLKATILDQDSLGLQYLQEPGTPSLRWAALRKSALVMDLSTEVAYKVVDRDLFSLRLVSGFGISAIAYGQFDKAGADRGVNDLEVYRKFDEWHSSKIPVEKEFNAYQGELDVDLENSPQSIFDQFSQAGSEFSLDPKLKRSVFPIFKFGFDANFQRYFVGFGFDMSLGGMDRFLLSDYYSIYMSVGYKIFQR